MLPEMTDEQRAAALARAGEARRVRAEIKHLLKTGSLTFTDVLERAEDDDLVAGAKVREIVASMPGMGKVGTDKVLAEIGIADGRTLRGLGINQKEQLIVRFS